MLSFYTKSNELITAAFNSYQAIFVRKNNDFSQCELKLSVNGATLLMSKAAFTDNDVPHMNYDTVFASSIVNEKIKRLIPNSFALSRTKRYLLNSANVLLALEKIIGGANDVVIIVLSASYETEKILGQSEFKKQVRYIPSAEYRFQDVIFVLREKDLPAIEFLDTKEEDKNELQLVEINRDLKIYASVIDINKTGNQILKEKWKLENESDNLDLKVQLAIAFLCIIYWRNDREIIQISLDSEFREQGIQNHINDIEPLSQ